MKNNKNNKNNKNSNLHSAKKVKNDEFYTQITDIENELKHYKDYFRGKVVFCNCDDPEESNFWKYFELNFEHLGLKKLISTHYNKDRSTYKLEITHDVNGDGKINDKDIVRTSLKQNGDFRSPECIDILKEADIVVTNPPFSLFREYIETLISLDKSFLVIGSDNSITYRDIFALIKDDKVWLGNSKPKTFLQPDGTVKKFGNISWFTNLKHKKRSEDIILFREYKGNENNYPFYENFNAININKLSEIPADYNGLMGVPITFIDKYNPAQFKIIGLGISNSGREIGVQPYKKEHKEYRKNVQKRGAVDGDLYLIENDEVKVPYARVIIKKK